MSRCFSQPGKATTRSTKRRPGTYEDVVRRHIEKVRPPAIAEMRWYATRPDFATALECAALCRAPNGKRHPHQQRLPAAVLHAAHEALQTQDLQSCTSFDELHGRVDDAISPIAGIGELAVYDIAQRVGAFLGLEPERVYLHRGVRDGALALGLGRGRRTLEVAELPAAFHRLQGWEIEDCLCLAKKRLRRITQRLQAIS